MKDWEKEFDAKWKRMRENGFGSTASIDGRLIWSVSDDEDSYVFADETIKNFIKALIHQVERDTLEGCVKELPNELGFEDYDKHMHSYIFEGRGKCEMCGLSWKKAGEYEMFNNAVIIMKKRLRGLIYESKEGIRRIWTYKIL